jgi:hypothetical protein
MDDILNYKGIKGEKAKKEAEKTMTDAEKKKISEIIIAAESQLNFN